MSTEEILFRRFVREAAQSYSKLPIAAAKKKNAFALGMMTYEAHIRNIAVTVEDGAIVYVSVDHPRLGFVEVSVPVLLPAA